MRWEGIPPHLASVPNTVENWVRINGCQARPAEAASDPADDASKLKEEFYSSECQDESEVIFYTIEEGGHKWPGASNMLQYWLSGNLSRDIDAASAIWEFFERHAAR